MGHMDKETQAFKHCNNFEFGTMAFGCSNYGKKNCERQIKIYCIIQTMLYDVSHKLGNKSM